MLSRTGGGKPSPGIVVDCTAGRISNPSIERTTIDQQRAEWDTRPAENRMGQVTPTSTASQQPTAVEVMPSSVPGPQRRSAIDPATVLGLNRGDRRVVAVLIVIAFTLMSLHWYRLTQYRPAPIVVLHPESYIFQLDVNRATWVEWMQLDRIGETLARRIVEDREQHGPFASVDDVQRVNGIGPKSLESLRPHLRCSTPSDEVAQ